VSWAVVGFAVSHPFCQRVSVGPRRALHQVVSVRRNRPNDTSSRRAHGDQRHMAQLRCIGRVSGAKEPDDPREDSVPVHFETPLPGDVCGCEPIISARAATITQARRWRLACAHKPHNARSSASAHCAHRPPHRDATGHPPYSIRRRRRGAHSLCLGKWGRRAAAMTRSSVRSGRMRAKLVISAASRPTV
jgi:hypothetical protein